MTTELPERRDNTDRPRGGRAALLLRTYSMSPLGRVPPLRRPGLVFAVDLAPSPFPTPSRTPLPLIADEFYRYIIFFKFFIFN